MGLVASAEVEADSIKAPTSSGGCVHCNMVCITEKLEVFSKEIITLYSGILSSSKKNGKENKLYVILRQRASQCILGN
jgi:hypothetical protein